MRSNLAAGVDIVAALVKGPQTHATLRVLLDCQKDVPKRHTTALHAKGLIHVSEWVSNGRGPWLSVWAWGPGVDAPYPGKKHVKHARVVKPVRVANSAFQWGQQ